MILIGRPGKDTMIQFNCSDTTLGRILTVLIGQPDGADWPTWQKYHNSVQML